VFATNITDRRRGDETYQLTSTQYVTGGNPDLDPETTVSTNIGAILQPRWARGLRLSIDYLESVRNDAIAHLGVQEFLDLEATSPQISERIQRAAPEPGAPDGVGRVTFVNARSININEISSKSLDLSVDYAIEKLAGGRLVLGAAASKLISQKIQTSPDTPPVEFAGNRELGPVPVWGGNVQARWESVQWSIGWSARYFDALLVKSAFVVAQGGDRVGSAFEHDVFANYRIAPSQAASGLREILSGASISLGIRNVFDREPRFWAEAYERGVAPYDSVGGRNLWLQVRKTFD
jgi:outer membrane receptor protein involved in Fe transport